MKRMRTLSLTLLALVCLCSFVSAAGISRV